MEPGLGGNGACPAGARPRKCSGLNPDPIAEAEVSSASPPLPTLRVEFRTVTPTDIPACHSIESASWPAGEAAKKASLQYRQHHAAPYFRCAILLPGLKEEAVTCDQGQDQCPVVGFICATRCQSLTANSPNTHDSTGPILAVHSVSVDPSYRRRGIASDMLRDYIEAMQSMSDGVEKVVLLVKEGLLTFFVKAGFTVARLSDITSGESGCALYEVEFDLEKQTEERGDTGATGATDTDGASRHTSKAAVASQCWVVDSFALPGPARVGSGNPAAVVLIDAEPQLESKADCGERAGEWMRTIAREFNLSETAFIWEKKCGAGNGAAAFEGEIDKSNKPLSTGTTDIERNDDEDSHYNIRFFTRTGTEVNLCGHATLASASILLRLIQSSSLGCSNSEEQVCKKGVIFHARRDILKAWYPGEDDVVKENIQDKGDRNLALAPARIAMDFPWKDLVDIASPSDRFAVLSMLRSAFDVTVENVLYMGVDEDRGDVLVELATPTFLRLGTNGDNVDYMALTKWEGYNRGIILCCLAGGSGPALAEDNPYGEKSDEESQCQPFDGSGAAVDFLSRFFGPKVGIDEDPVTGSAHCILGPYFGVKLGKDRLIGRQMSSRGGVVECILQKQKGEGKRVGIIGTAAIAISGTLHI